jgi:branched-subunit amino acid aminotransferase/4-amino-4-deoxychorismate lyase
MSLHWRNGQIEDQPAEAASPADWGAFTTAGCDRGRPLLWSRHLRRLSATLTNLGAVNDPVLPTEIELCDLLDAAGLEGPARVRVVARRVDPSLWNIEASAISCDASGPGLRPVKLTVQRWPSAPPLAGHKTLARLPWDLARERAQEKGYDDVLLVDSGDLLLETSVANVWVLKDGVVRTPRAPDRCLPGVMREWLLEHLSGEDLAAKVGELTFDDLMTAGEVWISNAIAGVRRVGAIGEHEWQGWPQFHRLSNLGIPAPGW